MIELIKRKIGNETIVGIIPINPKNLKIKFANISYSTGFGQWVIYFLISLFPAAFISFIVGSAIFTRDTSSAKLYALIILVIGILMFLSDYIYTSSIKKYPKTALIITNANLYFFAIKNAKFEVAHKFDVDINHLENILYGEINKKTNKIGEHFEIRTNNKTQLAGKIFIRNNQLFSADFPKENLFSSEKLRKIYLS